MYFKGFNKTPLALVIALALMFTTIVPAMAISNSLEDWANYAVAKQYEKYYEEEEKIGSKWGNIAPYDAYILSKAGVDVEEWSRQSTNLKDETLGVLKGLDKNSDVKHLAGGYLAASLLGDTSEAGRLIGLVSAKIDDNFGQNIYSDAPAIEYLALGDKLSVIDETYAVCAANAIIDIQFDNGAFGSTYLDNGEYIDSYEAMTTCQAIRGLHYLSKNIADDELKIRIKTSIIEGLNSLKKFPFGNEYDLIIDTYEILTTIKTLGLEGSNEWQGKFSDGLAYILSNSPNLDGKIGMGTVANYTAILDLAMVLDDEYRVADSFIYLNPPKFEIKKGDTKKLKVNKFNKVGTKEGIEDNLTWESDNPSIATVSDTGLVTGISTGTTTITATYGNLVAQGTVKVLGSSGGGTVPSDKQGIAYVTIRDDSGGFILTDAFYQWTDKGASVLEMLEKVLNERGISYIATGGYVSEIGGLAHQKPGYPLSGWKFKVNGLDADKGAGDFILRDGDKVEWYYTLDYREDEDSKSFNTEEKELEKDEKAQAALENFLNYLQEFEEVKQEVLIENLDKIMDKEKALLRDKELQAHLVDLSQLIDVTKDNIIKDENEKIVILVPEKALEKEVTLTVVEKIEKELPKAYPHKIMAPIFELGPAGLNFKQGVKIKIPIYLGSDFLPEQLTPAYFHDETEKWEGIPGIIDLAEGFAIIERDHFSKFTVIEKPMKRSFIDVNEDYAWAREAIEVLAGQDIIKGTNIGFEPNRNITRAEFAQLIYQMLAEPDSMPVEFAEFTDVRPSDWYSPAVSYLYYVDVITGYEDGSFKANQSLSRYEASLILYKLFKGGDNDNNINFKDHSGIPEWAQPAVNWAYDRNIVSGYEDDSFKGENPITRAESAVIVFNWLKN